MPAPPAGLHGLSVPSASVSHRRPRPAPATGTSQHVFLHAGARKVALHVSAAQISDDEFLDGLTAVVSYGEHATVLEEKRVVEDLNRTLQAENIRLQAEKRKVEDMLKELKQEKTKLANKLAVTK